MICRPRRSRVEPARPGEAHVTRGKVSGSELCRSSKVRAKPRRKAAPARSACSARGTGGRPTVGGNADGSARPRPVRRRVGSRRLNRERELGLDRRETG